MPSPRLLGRSGYRIMPWKNGLGTTTEIAVEPPDAGLDAFVWRLSIADLGASGPFSTFPGYDRVIVQLEGAPMTLSYEGGGAHRLQRFVPHRFAGELATHGTLEAPPARDFNVMVRRDRATAQVRIDTLATGSTARTEGERTTRMVHLLRGAAAVRAGGERFSLRAGETVVAPAVERLAVVAGANGTVALFVTLGPPGK